MGCACQLVIKENDNDDDDDDDDDDGQYRSVYFLFKPVAVIRMLQTFKSF